MAKKSIGIQRVFWSIPFIHLKMKRYSDFYCFYLFLQDFWSCKSVLLRINGVSKPRFETKESIVSYLSTNSFDLANGVFTGKDSTSFFQLIHLIRSLPSVDFYNPNGELIEYSTTGDCVGQAEIFAAGLMPNTKYMIDSSYQIKNVKEKVISIDGKSILSLDDADFILLIFWSEIPGKK